MQENSYTVRASSLCFILALVIPNIVGIFVLTILMSLFGTEGFDQTLVYQIVALFLNQIGFLIVYLILKAKCKVKTSYYFKEKIKVGDIFLILLIGLTCVFLISPLINVIDEFLTQIGFLSSSISLNLPPLQAFLILFFSLAIFAPLIEELVFRGVIFNGLREKGDVTAVVMSALFFTIIHLNIHQTIYQFLLGVLLALVYLYTRNFFSCFLLHFINNGAVLTINYINPSFFDYKFLSTNYIIIACILFVLGIIIIYHLLSFLRKRNNYKRTIINKNELKDANNSIKKYDFYVVSIIFGVLSWILSVLFL